MGMTNEKEDQNFIDFRFVFYFAGRGVALGTRQGKSSTNYPLTS